MENTNFNISFQNFKNEKTNINLNNGDILFVLGANGTGKSGLLQKIHSQYHLKCVRIFAQRSMIFGDIDLILHEDKVNNLKRELYSQNHGSQSRFFVYNIDSIPRYSMSNIFVAEQKRLRNIGIAFDKSDYDTANNLKNTQAPLALLNQLFQLIGIYLEIFINNDDKILVRKVDETTYNINELSDGEKNAFFICSDILTAKENSLLIIDEPEIHLHRSIISPLLTSLFQIRDDCAFVISTHDINLPLDNPNSKSLLLRGCQWNGKDISAWDADIIDDPLKIDDNIKLDILGSKRKILFVEGEIKSLDKQIYELIYPEVTVIPKKTCKDVIHAVEGLKSTDYLHWVDAIGLIDSDDRTEEEIKELEEKGIIALESYSVEYLYYNSYIIEEVAKKQDLNYQPFFEKAISTIIPNFERCRDSLSATLCERKIRSKIFKSLPKRKDILYNIDNEFKVEINIKDELSSELSMFDKFILNKDIDKLLSKYPFRESNVIKGIVESLGLIDRSRYESKVRDLLIQDDKVKNHYRALLSKLTDRISNI